MSKNFFKYFFSLIHSGRMVFVSNFGFVYCCWIFFFFFLFTFHILRRFFVRLFDNFLSELSTCDHFFTTFNSKCRQYFFHFLQTSRKLHNFFFEFSQKFLSLKLRKIFSLRKKIIHEFQFTASKSEPTQIVEVSSRTEELCSKTLPYSDNAHRGKI